MLKIQCQNCARLVSLDEGDEDHRVYALPSDVDPETQIVHVICRAHEIDGGDCGDR